MSSNRSRRWIVVLILLLATLVALLLFRRCTRPPQEVSAPVVPSAAAPDAPSDHAVTKSTDVAAEDAPERLGPAELKAPADVHAGASFSVSWKGPNNRQDYVTIVPVGADAAQYKSYAETRHGETLELTAAMEPGDYEVRYVTGRSKTVLARALVKVSPVGAELDAPGEVVAGTAVQVRWKGPANTGDYVTLVPKSTPDGKYGNYADVRHGSPLEVVAPMDVGPAELRYMSGQGAKVLGRRDIAIVAAKVTLDAPAEAIAGSEVPVTWKGPNNRGDYITIVAKGTPDGKYANYSDARHGSPLNVKAPIEPGDVELRYMSGQGAQVLARRSLKIVPAKITLDAPNQVPAGGAFEVTWTGPKHTGDYITIVPKAAADAVYGSYADTRYGSPSKLTAPKEAGAAEIRFVSGQGKKVLARRDIRVE